jgi:hypothetical protein
VWLAVTVLPERAPVLVVVSPQSTVALTGVPAVTTSPPMENEYALSAVAVRVRLPAATAALVPADLGVKTDLLPELVNVLNPDFSAVSGEPLGLAPLAAGCEASPANARAGTSATPTARTAVIVAIRR